VNARESILIRGVNWLGDAVMATPALLRLREAKPRARLVLLTPAKLAGLWMHHPALDETLSIEPGEGLFHLAQRLRSRHFSSALVLPNSFRSALEVWLARIPHRVGYAANLRSWLLTRPVPLRREAVPMRKRPLAEIHYLLAHPDVQTPIPPPSAHHLHHYLHLAAALGANPEPLAPQIHVSEAELLAARMKVGVVPNGRPILGLNPGAEYGPAKRWPLERFIAAALEIRRHTNCRWVLLGGRNDVDFAGELMMALGEADCVNLAGRTSLRELCAVLRLCRVVLTNDTGPMHLAAAVGTPVVAPFGSTSPELTGPGLPGEAMHQLLRAGASCSPCFRRECPVDFRCMTGISVERVVEAVLRQTR
jgi:lipopolysaccharide heptosyltransferase II